jgi:DDE superfamily endonuclease
MPTPSPAIVPLVPLLAAFAPAFTAPTFAHALLLVYGTLLASGRRTVTAALRAVGLRDERHFTTYHRVLNHAIWSPLTLSKILLGLLVTVFLAADDPLLLVIDDTLERRYGRRVADTGRYHDAVRSTTGHIATCSGIRWLCVGILVRVPWSSRSWALPFLTVPSPTPATSRRLRKRHRTVPERAAVLVQIVRRWQPDRAIVLVGDSGYGVVALAATCRQRDVTFVARLRLTAALYAPVPPQPKGKPGVKPQKGPRLPTPGAVLKNPDTAWESVAVPWYGGETKTFDAVSETALWHRDGEPPVPIRWVLLRDPTGTLKPVVLGCIDQAATPLQIVTWYVGRWNIEVTFEESRCHLGVETQRQWSRRAIERTTPCVLGLFSLVTVMAHALHDARLPIRQSAWYAKEEATFRDALAVVRRHLWASYLANPPTATSAPEVVNSPALFLSSLVEAACYAA